MTNTADVPPYNTYRTMPCSLHNGNGKKQEKIKLKYFKPIYSKDDLCITYRYVHIFDAILITCPVFVPWISVMSAFCIL